MEFLGTFQNGKGNQFNPFLASKSDKKKLAANLDTDIIFLWQDECIRVKNLNMKEVDVEFMANPIFISLVLMKLLISSAIYQQW